MLPFSFLWFTTAWAGPHATLGDSLDTYAVRAAALDEILGAPSEPWPIDTTLRTPLFTVSPKARLSAGNLVPVHAFGDDEPGLVSPRLGADARLYAGPFDARLDLDLGGDFLPGASGTPRLQALRVGAHGTGWFVALTDEPRWFGPAHEGALLYGDAGPPLPAVAAGIDGHLPGKLVGLGRFGLQAYVGFLPGTRSDIDHPEWLLIDARWLPFPGLELGATRNAIFGGSDENGPRPIDIGQLLLPTEPHVDDDPDYALHDSDERASIDIRLTLPLRQWGLPLDYAEAYVQHGGEDVIARRLGPLAYPTLAGAANIYGGEVALEGFFLGAEFAVIQDDLYRWYTGHRLYHEGWTANGFSLGHPSGGDSRTLTFRAGRLDPTGFSLEATYSRIERVQVADVVNDTVFVFQGMETSDTAGLRVGRTTSDGGELSSTLEIASVRDREFTRGNNAFEGRFSLCWRFRQLVFKKTGAESN